MNGHLNCKLVSETTTSMAPLEDRSSISEGVKIKYLSVFFSLVLFFRFKSDVQKISE